MKYQDYHYIWPPRPDLAIPRSLIQMHEKEGWVAQTKKNGTCNLIAVSPAKELVCMTRHKTAHKAWAPTPKSSELFKSLPGNGWYVFVAELLHSKTPHIKDTNYLHEILVADGEYLIGTKQSQRQAILHKLLDHLVSGETKTHFILNNHTWLTKEFRSGFVDVFDSLDQSEDEGLVLKNPNGVLEFGNKERNNLSWLRKCRKGTKNFGF